MIKIKRVYEEPDKDDGFRILVDRIWPRGLSKEKAKTDLWLKEIAPSTALRKWFGHEEPQWEEFKKRYISELTQNPAVAQLKETEKQHKTITLLYGARDEKHNQAVVISEFLKQ